MDDLYRAFDDRAQVILQRIDAKQWDLLVGVIESTDRVQHMMWRLIDPTHPMCDKGAGGEFGDCDRARLPASATSSSARSCRASIREHADSDRLRTTASTRSGSR